MFTLYNYGNINLAFKLVVKVTLLLGLVLVVSCKHSTTSTPDLEFNQVIHYSILIDDETLFDLASEDRLTVNEQLKIDVMLNDKTKNLSDTLFIEKLESLGFTKTQFNTKQVSQLQNLFIIANENTNSVNECINIYRDILILKQDNQIKEIAKVCLECEVVQWTSKDRQVFNLESISFQQLEEILVK